MKKTKKKIKFKAGFTLIELLIVIAIISIMAGVVLVNSKSAVDKSKRTSILTTASSILPELVTCQDDSGVVDSGIPAAGDIVCCSASMAHCDAAHEVAGHSTPWPDPNLNSLGWKYKAESGALSTGDYTFTLTQITASGQSDITCSMATNGCQ